MAASSSCQAQIERLRDWGYVVVPRSVPADTLAQLNAKIIGTAESPSLAPGDAVFIPLQSAARQ